MGWSKVALCAAVAFVVSGCKTVQNPAAFTRQKLAVATWYSEQKIMANSGGLIGGIQSMSTEWGKELLDAAYANEFQAKLQKTIGGEWVPAENVVKATAYATVPEPSLKNYYYAPLGMKPMDIGEQSYPMLSTLAKEVGAEAVVGVENRWTMNADNRGGQYCTVNMRIYMVDDKNTLLYEKRVWAEGRPGMNGIQLAAELVGAISPDNAKAMCKAATMAALDKFAEAWTEGKAEAAKAPAPAATTTEAKPADGQPEAKPAEPAAEPK